MDHNSADFLIGKTITELTITEFEVTLQTKESKYEFSPSASDPNEFECSLQSYGVTENILNEPITKVSFEIGGGSGVEWTYLKIWTSKGMVSLEWAYDADPESSKDMYIAISEL